MADDEQFSLCWHNFNTNLSAGCHESLCRGELVDVTLVAEGQLMKAHRLVLSICSPYFRKMFIQMPANQHAFVFLKDVRYSTLKDLIQFMYCGEVNVKQEALLAFVSTAEALQIKGLTDSDPPASQTHPEPSTPMQQTPRFHTKQTKSIIDPPDIAKIVTSTANTQIQPQQITVQSAVRTTDKSKIQPARPQISAEREYIDLATIELPEYSEDTGEVVMGEQDTSYVEDDAYGDMHYYENYFTENEDEAPAVGAANASQSFSYSSYVDPADDTNAEAQARDETILPFEVVNRAVLLDVANESFLPNLPDGTTLAVKTGIAKRERPFVESRTIDDWNDLTYTDTASGNKTLHYKGNSYVRNSRYEGNIYWKCAKWRRNCRARLITHEAHPTKYVTRGMHNH